MRGIEKIGLWAAGALIAIGGGLVSFDAEAVRYDNIIVNIEPSTPNVSYGAPGAYTFYIKNETNGTINNLRFRAYLNVGTFAETNPINAGAPATCTRVTPQMIDCAITAGVVSFGFSTFDFAFEAPAESSNATLVTLDWDVRFGQGSASNFISTITGTPGALPVSIALIQNSDTEAKAYIPPTGFNLYTGTSIPSGSDPFTVGILVDPAANRVVTAGIFEPNQAACSQPTRRCAQLDVLRKEVLSDGTLKFFKAVYTGVEGTTDLDKRLVVVLRFAASEVAGRNVNQLNVFYTEDDDGDENTPVPTPQQLFACPKRKPDYVPPVGEPPCIASKIQYTKRTAPDPSLIGAVEVVLWASRNGFVDSGW